MRINIKKWIFSLIKVFSITKLTLPPKFRSWDAKATWNPPPKFFCILDERNTTSPLPGLIKMSDVTLVMRELFTSPLLLINVRFCKVTRGWDESGKYSARVLVNSVAQLRRNSQFRISTSEYRRTTSAWMAPLVFPSARLSVKVSLTIDKLPMCNMYRPTAPPPQTR